MKGAFIISFIFFLAYSTLSVFRHLHYGSFGYDLGIADQIVWNYSRLKPAISTIDHVTFINELFVHLEFVYMFLAPFYWIYESALMLIVLQVLFVTSSGIPIFLLARKHKLNIFLSYLLLISYLMFYGIQNALWFDVHSAAFGASFLAWFIYFLDQKHFRLSITFFILTLLCKENFALILGLVSFVYFVLRRDRKILIFMALAVIYLLAVFFIYFPNFVPDGYRFQSKEGLLTGISLTDFANTKEKQEVIFYTFVWTGFLSILNPLFLLPILGNLASYFIFAREVSTTQGLYLQYRIELAPLLFLATIYGISRFKKLNKAWVGMYLLICALAMQYFLHLPLSYLAKKWFWQELPSVKNVNSIIKSIPDNYSIITQNNIVPHLSQREKILVLWGEKKDFKKNSPCGDVNCNWFSGLKEADYLLADTSGDWDVRHLLVDRANFIDGLKNLENSKVVRLIAEQGSSKLYKIDKRKLSEVDP